MYKFNGYYNKYTYHKLKNESDCTFKGYPKEKIKLKNTKEYLSKSDKIVKNPQFQNTFKSRIR